MTQEFEKDLRNAKNAERIVLEVLRSATDKYTFTDVSNDKEYWHIGDIRAEDNISHSKIYIDVKDDKTFNRTHNFLAEDGIYWSCKKQLKDGFMINSKYDYIAYVSRNEKKIYILDFKWWQAVYESGKFMMIPHKDQTTFCYLNSLKDMINMGVIIAEIDFHIPEDSTNWQVKSIKKYIDIT